MKQIINVFNTNKNLILYSPEFYSIQVDDN